MVKDPFLAKRAMTMEREKKQAPDKRNNSAATADS